MEHPTLTPLPFIVVIIDELADMMMIVGKKVEELIAGWRKKRALPASHVAGHPAAVGRCHHGPHQGQHSDAYRFPGVGEGGLAHHSRSDGRENTCWVTATCCTCRRASSAEARSRRVCRRCRGPSVVANLKKSAVPRYIDEILVGPASPIPECPDEQRSAGERGQRADPLYDQAVRIVVETRKASISGVQRRLKIGYNRAARMVEAMEEAGLVGPLESNGAREVLAPPPEED